jgi:hypothetical protein
MNNGLLTGTALLLLSVGPSAQIGYLWEPDELAAKSVVVVLATPVRTVETGIKTELSDLTPAFPVIELQTEFKVLAILKGVLPEPTFMLRHYRADVSRLIPGVVGGAGALSVADTGAWYLLFLRRDPAGALIPTSGHVFPADSVYTLRKAG